MPEYPEVFINRCERATTTDIKCPVCGKFYILQDLEKHLGHHLEEVALLALSHPGEGKTWLENQKVDWPEPSTWLSPHPPPPPSPPPTGVTRDSPQ